MKLNSKDNTPRLDSKYGEMIHELIGSGVGDSTELHSVAYVIIPPDKSSLLHYHPLAEESYYFLKGKGTLVIEDEETTVFPGQAVLIRPTKRHKISNTGETDLEFLAVCVPAWKPTNTVFLETFEDENSGE
jgi:mannose-6-phosphate isomerase-like protein (cupin superfamily)